MSRARLFVITIAFAVVSGNALGDDNVVAKTTPDSAAKQDQDKGTKPSPDEKKEDGTLQNLPGHSVHGEAFNEGPRQKAYLMDGMANITFPCTSKNEEAKKFVVQGVAQMHGFWNYEAERSFRQAAKLDPDCAIAYWGMALANLSNSKRSKEFIAKAMKKKDLASDHERRYIEALNGYITSTKKKKDKSGAYAKALEKILYDYPDDVEARAFLALEFWKNRSSGGANSSYLAIDALLGQVFQANPRHPAHHYRIHLWDHEKPAFAVKSSAVCGQSSPGIAHMWHMPGHIFSRLKRYNDAAWQQEASARVDHSHMMRDRVLPDQIHNFAHNNEWLIRNLIFAGRANDAVNLAKNMTELPRHPKHNTITKRRSAYYGRLRLFQALRNFEMWDEMAALCDTPYLEPTEESREQLKRSRHLAVAYYRNGDTDAGNKLLAETQSKLNDVKKEKQEAVDKAEQESVAKIVDKKKIAAAGDNAASMEEEKIRQEQKLAAEKAAEEAASNVDEPAADDKDANASPKDADAPKSEDRSAEEIKPEDPPQDEPVEEAKPDTTEADNTKRIQTARLAAEKVERERQIKAKQKDIDKAKKSAGSKFDSKIREIEKAVNEMEGNQLVSEGKYKEGLEKIRKAGGENAMVLAMLQLKSGEVDKAIEAAKSYVGSHKNETIPLSQQVQILWEAEKRDEAKKAFDALRELSSAIDLDAPVFAALAPIAKQLEYPDDWKIVKPTADDIGQRPDLDSLGPFRWQPLPAPSWTLSDSDSKPRSLSDYSGKPVVVIFYLGFECLHCAEQLHKFAPKAEEYEKAGISIIAVSTDNLKGLKQSIEDYEKGTMPFPLVSDDKLEVFKQFRAFDDFEEAALHGTFLIDAQGMVRWQDVSYEPFMDADFLLKEAKRLLAQ